MTELSMTAALVDLRGRVATLEQLTSPKPQSTELIPLAEYRRVVAELESYKLREAFDKLPVARPILPSNPPTAFKSHGCVAPEPHPFGAMDDCGVHITDKNGKVTCIRLG